MRRLGVVMAMAACTAPSGGEPVGVCDRVGPLALRAVDRQIVGAGASWTADATLRGRDAEIAGSMALRREVAWNTVAKLVTPVDLAVELPFAGAQLPTWQTWYHIDDLRRVFDRLYAALPDEDKAVRARFDDASLDAAFLWNTTAVSEDPSWPEDRYLATLDALDTASDVAGLGGLSRVAYNGPAARHLLASYPEVLACRDAGPPPPRATGPATVVPVTRVPVDVAPCGQQTVTTVAVAESETLLAELEGNGILALLTDGVACTTVDGPCEVAGPATVEIVVIADEDPVEAIVDVRRRSAAPPAWAGCLDGPFPLDAAILKADYRRADFDFGMPVFDTSADALEERLVTSWDEPDGFSDPSDADVYTLTMPSGSSFRLSALHVMTKELDHWLWATLWWSDDPTSDFGADRPQTLPAPWSSYKMCVTTDFVEADPTPWSGVADAGLADALAVTHPGEGEPTWCSNPYLEIGHGNSATNCVGCHQHGGTAEQSRDILEREDRGRLAERNNFPADYAWSLTQGDDLEQLFADRELFYGARR